MFRVQCFSVLVAVASVVIYFIPAPIDPEPYIFEEKPPQLTGPLKVNNVLQRTEKMFIDTLIGPESFTVDKAGVLYTGTADGKIWKIVNNEAHLLTRTGINHPLCGSFDYEPECGRPKGLKIHPDGNLYVADSYKGLLRVNTTTGQIQTLLTEAGGTPFKFLNGLDITRNGIVYFTDSSTKWDRRNYRYEVMETNNFGRVIMYDPEVGQGQGQVILDGLYLANGISLAPDETFLLVSQMSICQILKYYRTGKKMGQTEIFQRNLPGYPDNIKLTGHKTFYVGLGSVRHMETSLMGPFLDLIGPYPSIKKLVTKLMPFAAYSVFLPKHAMFVELDLHGNIINSYHDPQGVTVATVVSEAFQHNGSIYLGHFSASYLGKLDIKYL